MNKKTDTDAQDNLHVITKDTMVIGVPVEPGGVASFANATGDRIRLRVEVMGSAPSRQMYSGQYVLMHPSTYQYLRSIGAKEDGVYHQVGTNTVGEARKFATIADAVTFASALIDQSRNTHYLCPHVCRIDSATGKVVEDLGSVEDLGLTLNNSYKRNH